MFINDTSTLKVIKHILWGASNIAELQISVNLPYYFKPVNFCRLLNKSNVSGLKDICFDRISIDVKHLSKILHRCDSLVSLKLSKCLTSGNPSNMKINTLSRFQLIFLTFWDGNSEFFIEDLAYKMMQNESLRQNTEIEFYRQNHGSKKLILKYLIISQY